MTLDGTGEKRKVELLEIFGTRTQHMFLAEKNSDLGKRVNLGTIQYIRNMLSYQSIEDENLSYKFLEEMRRVFRNSFKNLDELVYSWNSEKEELRIRALGDMEYKNSRIKFEGFEMSLAYQMNFCPAFDTFINEEEAASSKKKAEDEDEDDDDEDEDDSGQNSNTQKILLAVGDTLDSAFTMPKKYKNMVASKDRSLREPSQCSFHTIKIPKDKKSIKMRGMRNLILREFTQNASTGKVEFEEGKYIAYDGPSVEENIAHRKLLRTKLEVLSQERSAGLWEKTINLPDKCYVMVMDDANHRTQSIPKANRMEVKGTTVFKVAIH